VDSRNGHRELWLVRHGQTPASLARTLAGWKDVPLTAAGEAQAAALRPVLAAERFCGVWSSDLQRALTSARLAYGEPTADRRLREMSFGRLEGVLWETLEPRWQDALTRFEGFEPPGGETFAELQARVFSFVDALPTGRHLVFTHGGVVRLLSREAGEDYFVPTGSLLVMAWEARRIVSRRDGAGEASRSLPLVGREAGGGRVAGPEGAALAPSRHR
jgi:2,3-bisphosphoglycerate-dependent phosphoglycerate mutase